MTKFIDHADAFEIGPGGILRRFTEKEAGGLAERWIEVFCQHKRGANIKAYMWHIFSAGKYPSVAGADARATYARHAAAEYVVLSNERKSALLTDALPESCSQSDYYVFPANMAWTMAFTHEEGWLGPYFALHPNYKSLNAENLDHMRARSRKSQEIEKAKRKGWA